MDPDHPPIPSLQAIFNGAKHFGLTDDEVWRTIDEYVWTAAAPEDMDELAGALARRIMAKQRRALSEERRVLF